MSKKRPVEFELEEGRPERHKQDIAGRQPVDREIAERGRGIEKDQVIGIQHPVGGQHVGQRIPELPAPRRHPPDRDLELRPVKVQLRPDEIDVRPVRLLDKRRRRDLQGLGQGFIERQGRLAAIQAALVLGPQMQRVMPRDQRKHGPPFIRDAPAEDRGHRAL